MSTGCRDCRTCTMPGGSRLGLRVGMGLLYLYTLWIAAAVKRGTMRHCPQCGHVLGRHQRRADRSFID